ncbi:PaaI family thioesterase [Parasphingopyxis marina]|uniref:PaaI family thioesterase n=1 Tax=Parasphingopyxis marina TaxID=2761622 RepID=A0A842I2M0_9SPHN|nr:PaaI family thioesterase [Parasphingopyxis marina]MBC2778989.1 PaaI family thioesterase [Parasphingopyxis marina]
MAGFNALIGLDIVGPEADGGFVVELAVRPCHLHGAAQVHGGVYLALADTAMARAAQHRVGPDQFTPTVELKTNFLRACASGKIVATGHVVRAGKRLVFAEAELHSATGDLLATASATLIRSGKSPGAGAEK